METRTTWYITSFYQFAPLPESELEPLQTRVKTWIKDHQVIGLILLAKEGMNATVAGPFEAIDPFKDLCREITGVSEIRFKDSSCDFKPFHRTSVHIRDEIVGLKRTDLVPTKSEDHHLTPAEWHQMLESPEPKIIIDTRNDYEIKLGKFPGAIVPGLKSFSEWTDYADKTPLPGDIPVLIYCTGGIRCEKVMLDLQERGHQNVYQLRDGILGYLQEFPQGHFDGECFVYDDRVAVGPGIVPTSKFGICPGCGHPGSTKLTCERCSTDYFKCESCEGKWNRVCSKTCWSYTVDK